MEWAAAGQTVDNVTAPLSAWEDLGAPVAVGSGVYQFTDPGAATHSRRFYRVSVP